MKDKSIIISSRHALLKINLKEIYAYRDLLFLFVKRDLITMYKQTVLGPLWYVFQPLITTFVYIFVFGKLAKFSTDGIPDILFYLSGVIIWGYFSDCLVKTSNTFIANQNLFGKVYFPRVIIPLSILISNLSKLTIQLIVFISLYVYYFFNGAVSFNYFMLFSPFFLILCGVVGIGIGMLCSSMTTKYRDLQFLVRFGVQLWMYATPVIYPLSVVPEHYLVYIKYNPITPLVVFFRNGFFGFEVIGIGYLFSSVFTCVIIFILGFILFNRVEKNFMDTV